MSQALTKLTKDNEYKRKEIEDIEEKIKLCVSQNSIIWKQFSTIQCIMQDSVIKDFTKAESPGPNEKNTTPTEYFLRSRTSTPISSTINWFLFIASNIIVIVMKSNVMFGALWSIIQCCFG